MKFSLLLLTAVCAKNVVDLTSLQKADRDRDQLEKRRLFDAANNIIRLSPISIPLFKQPTDQEFLSPTYGEHPQDGPTLLTSSIATNKKISLFASYVRDNLPISQKFNNKDTSSIVFAPIDSAVESLSLKPWQFPIPIIETLSEEEIDTIIAQNKEDYVLSHVVDGEVPFNALDGKRGVQLKTQNGKNIKLVSDEDGDYYVAVVKNDSTSAEEEWIRVESVVDVKNGVLLVIGKSLSYPEIL